MKSIISRQCKLAVYFGFPSMSGRLSKIKRVYPALIYLVYVSFTAHCLFLRSASYIKLFTLVQTITDLLMLFSEVFFVSACLLWTRNRVWRWRTFWNNLAVLDKNLEKLHFENKQSWVLNIVVLCTCFAVVFLSHIYEVLFWCSMEKYNIIYIYMNSKIVMYYQLFVVVLICFVTRMFKLRLDFLKRHLLKVMARRRNIIRTETLDEIQEISKLYGTVYSLVKLFNGIFGWQIYFIIMGSVTEILSSVSFGLELFYHMKMNKMFVVNLIYCAMYLSFTVSVVLSCDRVEKSGKAFGEACVLLQQGISDCSTRKELQFLAQFVTGLAPEITSAGFYNINQSVLMSIFSTAATYVIIYLQFNKK